MPSRIFQSSLIFLLLLLFPQFDALADEKDKDLTESNGVAIEMGYGNSFAGIGLGGEGMINLYQDLNLSMLASYGYLGEVSGYALGGRILYGSHHRGFLEYTYGLIGYEKGDVIENSQEEDVKKEVYGSSASLGYQYIYKNGLLGLCSLGISVGEGKYEDSIDISTFNIGIGYKFNFKSLQ